LLHYILSTKMRAREKNCTGSQKKQMKRNKKKSEQSIMETPGYNETRDDEEQISLVGRFKKNRKKERKKDERERER
jgi:hypothetical protein